MKFRSKKLLFVYFDEYNSFRIYSDEIKVESNYFRFFYKGSEVGSILKCSCHHIEYFNSMFDTETIYISKTELLNRR